MYNFYIRFDFEFDELKSRSNKVKHGIDFDEARTLWDDPRLLEIPLSTPDKPRVMFIGTIQGRHWSAVATRRQDRIRIISVRRSRREEKELYES